MLFFYFSLRQYISALSTSALFLFWVLFVSLPQTHNHHQLFCKCMRRERKTEHKNAVLDKDLLQLFTNGFFFRVLSLTLNSTQIFNTISISTSISFPFSFPKSSYPLSLSFLFLGFCNGIGLNLCFFFLVLSFLCGWVLGFFEECLVVKVSWHGLVSVAQRVNSSVFIFLSLQDEVFFLYLWFGKL